MRYNDVGGLFLRAPRPAQGTRPDRISVCLQEIPLVKRYLVWKDVVMVRRFLSFALACLMLVTGAQAAFSPVMEGLSEGAELRASLKLETLTPLSQPSLDVLNSILSGTEIVVTQRQAGDTARARTLMTVKGEALIDVVSMHRRDYSLTAFLQEDGAYHAYLTAENRPDAFAALSGENGYAVAPDALIRAFADGTKEMYALLETVVKPKTVKGSTSIKNAGTSTQYIDYKLNADEMNGAWGKLIDAMLPFFDAALLSMPGAAEKARIHLQSLTFSGESRFKRMLNKAGEDIGLQFTGHAADGEDARKVTVFGGYTEGAGMYLSFALPAVKGKNNFKLTVSFKLTEKKTQNTLTTDITYANTLDGVTETAELTSTLKNNLSNGEAITGKITVTTKKNGIKQVYTIEPKLTAEKGADELTGTVSFQRKTAGSTDMKGVFTLTYGGIALRDDVTEDIQNTLDLTGMTDEMVSASLSGEKTLLLSRMIRLFAALPEGERTLLTHDMRTEAWMTAPNIAPLATNAPYLVTEEE